MNDFKSEVSRLVVAAVVNRRFRQTLLTNPAKALEGYGNETFEFTLTEREMILSIRVSTLEEFADQVQQLVTKTQESESAIQNRSFPYISIYINIKTCLLNIQSIYLQKIISIAFNSICLWISYVKTRSAPSRSLIR